MRFLLGLILALAFIGALHAQTISTLNGKSVGCAVSGNIVTLNGKTIGTTSGNINKINNLSAPTCAPGSQQQSVLLLSPGQPIVFTAGSPIVFGSGGN